MRRILFWALAISAGMSGGVEASTYDIGALSATPFVTFAHEPPGRFSNRYDFSIETTSAAAGGIANIPLKLFDVRILNIRGLTLSVFDSADNLLLTGRRLSWLAEPGAYHVEIAGRATGIHGGAYALSMTALPVPVPAALWLFLSGAAGLLMGCRAVIRRPGRAPAGAP